MVDWEFVKAHIGENPLALTLKYGSDADVADSILQIKCRRKAASRLRQTLECPSFVFPTRLSAEQCTSDALAAWHASLIPPGCRVIDLTAGLGIDAFHMARRAAHVTCVERDPRVAAALEANAASIGLSNVNVVCADCRDLAARGYDVAFIDPARRGERGERLYDPGQCEPDVAAMLPQISHMAPRLIVKLSPMFDIEALRRYFGVRLTRITAVGTPSECAELVAELAFGTSHRPSLGAVTVTEGRYLLAEVLPDRAKTAAVSPRPGDFLIEPYPPVMKIGALNVDAPWKPVHPEVPLFVSPTPVSDLGRTWQVRDVVPFTSANIKALARKPLSGQVAVRTFPLTAVQLAERMRVRQDDSRRIIGTKIDGAGPSLLFLSRLP